MSELHCGWKHSRAHNIHDDNEAAPLLTDRPLVFIFTSVTQNAEDIQGLLFLQYKRYKNICLNVQ